MQEALKKKTDRKGGRASVAIGCTDCCVDVVVGVFDVVDVYLICIFCKVVQSQNHVV